MINNKKVLALIPARGGSKGLPGKNIKPIAGKPLIAWSIEQALNNKYIDEVMVSTDCNDISTVAKEFGADVPFLRPEALSGDTAKSIDVIEHAIEILKNNNKNYDILLLLEPTSPLRTDDDISKALELLINNNKAESIVSVGKVESQHPGFCVTLDNDFIYPYEQSHSTARRQDLSDLYYYDGTIYASYINTLLNKKTFYHNSTLGYLVEKYQTFEIDDVCDFVIVEALLNAKSKGIL